MREVILASGGTMMAVEEDAIARARELVREAEGLDICASSALTIAAAAELATSGVIRRDAVVLLNLTGGDRDPSHRPADFLVQREIDGWNVTPTAVTSVAAVRGAGA
jgi:hypothetical protein